MKRAALLVTVAILAAAGCTGANGGVSGSASCSGLVIFDGRDYLPTEKSDFTVGEQEVLRLDTPAGVVTTRAGTRDGLLAIGVTRTTRRIGDATLVLPDDEPLEPTLPALAAASAS